MAKIIAVNASYLDDYYLGKILTPELIAEFIQLGVHSAGEKGK